MKSSDSPQFDPRDEITKVRQEIETVRNSVEFLAKELSSCKEMIAGLQQGGYGGPSGEQAEARSIDKLCNNYVSIVETVGIARQVFLVEDDNVAALWTIIEAPSEDSLRASYDEEVALLKTLEQNMPVDFYVLDTSELSEGETVESIMPSGAKLVWER